MDDAQERLEENIGTTNDNGQPLSADAALESDVVTADAQATDPETMVDASAEAEEVSADAVRPPSGEPVDLQSELDRLRAEAAANLEGWQRARAEFANYKKRSDAERSQLVFLTGVKIVEKMLPVIDDFDRAIANLPDDLKDNGWIDGVLMTRRKLIGLLEDEGVTPISVKPGDAFDPAIHEAVTHEESEEFAAGQIIAELQKGYRIDERVLRPALVRVAR
ncbi:MAG: nucleotide exchange factor GrpE [Anaerolineae bacterium]